MDSPKDLCGGPGWGRVGCRDWQKVRSVCCTVLAGICSHFLERESLGLKSNETNHKCENVEHLKLNIYRKCNMFQVRSFYTDLSRNIKK